MKINRKDISNSWLFVTDVDDTLLGDDNALIIFAQALQRRREQIVFILNSSRPCASLRSSIHKNPHIPFPDYLIGALGTEIETGLSSLPIPKFVSTINSGWDRDQITTLMRQIGLEAHPAEFQTPLKASYTVMGKEQADQVREELARHKLDCRVIFSGGSNLDLIPRQAGKGNAIEYLRRNLGIDPLKVVTAGDSVNDLDMFVAPNKAIIVANADTTIRALQGEHIYQAQKEYADGLLEGLQYWGIIT